MPAWLEDDGPYPGNGTAFRGLREVIARGDAVAFVGAGASAPIYPVWRPFLAGMIASLERTGLSSSRAKELRGQIHRALFVASEAVEINPVAAFKYIAKTFAPRPKSAHTRTHAALMGLPFLGYVTTNFDLGLEHARDALRARAETTSDLSINDSGAEDCWRGPQGRAFSPGAQSVLHLHGRYDEGSGIVLSLEQYREAYAGACRRILQSLWERRGLVLIGYGFSDPWIEFVTQNAMLGLSTNSRHFAIVGVEEGEQEDARFFEKTYGVRPIFYPIQPGGDHSALLEVLEQLDLRREDTVVGAGLDAPSKRDHQIAVAGLWERSLGRRGVLLQYLGMTSASGMIMAPIAGWSVSAAWVTLAFCFAGARLLLESFLQRRLERKNAHWRVRLRPPAIFLEEMIVCTMSLACWLMGGPTGAFIAALILFISMQRVVNSTTDSAAAMCWGIAAPALLMAAAPVFIALYGGSTIIVTATAIMVGVTITNALSTWQRMRDVLGY